MAADKQRGRQTVRDMVLSLGVIVLAAAFMYLFIPHDDTKDPVKPVGYRVELTSARRAAPYPVLAPAGLPAAWRATSVQYTPTGQNGATWHLGLMTPDDQYAAVEQADSPDPAAWIAGVTQGAHRTARTVRIHGADWTRYQGRKYNALVRQHPGRPAPAADSPEAGAGTSIGKGKARNTAHTTVVTGTASETQLERLAGALSDKAAGTPDPKGQTG